jgi:ATP phosphoribosyltransferase regulatory subunit
MALTWEDKITLALRSLYEQYGCRQYHMGTFEPYDMYRENRNFLQSETVITFTGASGKLMALKPDVTMSIVKSTQPEEKMRKLYYSENVFRMARGSHDYKEIHQIGLEYIGSDDGYSEAETVLMALKSLELISPDYVLTAGHMGFTAALMAKCGFDKQECSRAMSAFEHKNAHELATLAEAKNLPEETITLLSQTMSISHPAAEAIKVLRSMNLDGDMATALYELERLYSVLDAAGYGDRLRIDFAIVNDSDYYNGIVFQGFVHGIAHYVLSGGRYDNLMRRFGKPQSAIGFALYFGEMNRHFREEREYDADILLVYGAVPAKVMAETEKLVKAGHHVIAAKAMQNDVRVKKILVFNENGEIEEAHK